MSQTESRKMFMDRKLYDAAVEAKIDVLMEEQAELDSLMTPKNNTILHIHILAQHPSMESTQFLQRALQMCPSLLSKANAKGEIPLHIAAKYGHVGAVKALIERAKSLGLQPRGSTGYKQKMLWVTNNEKDTALHEAVRMNHIDVVRLLIAEDSEYSYSGNAAGESPLYLAVERGYNDIAYEILERCKSPDHGGRNGRTTLHAAVIREDSEMTKTILMKTHTALTSKVDVEGWTPLHYSTQNEYMVNFIMLLAVDKSAAYIASKDKQWTPLYIAIRTGSMNIVKELILQCPDCVELMDHQGWNILHHAIDKNEVQALSFLLQNPVTSKLLNDKDTYGNTPVHQIASTSCGHNHYSDAFFALAPLVDKNALNDMEQTPLDILLEDIDQSGNVAKEKKSFTEEMMRKGFKQSIANKIEGRKAVKPQTAPRSDEESLTKRRNMFKESHLAVATLIAIVTFAASFTSLPGDYISDHEGGRPHDHDRGQGLEIFSRKTAFQAFVVCHTVAMVLSICGVYTYVLMSAEEGKNMFASSFFGTYLSTIIAMGAAVFALVTGTYALLSVSKWLTLSIIVIISLLCFRVPWISRLLTQQLMTGLMMWLCILL